MSNTPQTSVAAEGNSTTTRWLSKLRYNGVLALTVLTIVGLAVFIPQFATASNLANVLQEASLVGIVTMGMAILLISGNFDLSVPGTVQLGSILLASTANKLGLAVGLIVVIAFGIVVGLINGLIVTRLGVNSLITTLGTGFVMTGLAFVVTNGSPIAFVDQGLNNTINATIVGFPVAGIMWFAVALAATWILHLTIMGRQIRAVGSNEEASRMAGVRVKLVRLVPFILTGLFSAVTAVIAAGLVNAGDPNVGATWSLQAIAAAVVGGVAITGGLGSVPMAVVGVALISLIHNAFVLTDLNSNFEQVLTGAILIIAVAFDVGVRAGPRVKLGKPSVEAVSSG